ncbi:MAG TPA: hypothetical protein VFV39_12750 [Limnobacter sp.]|nr:hypothetical protein [Limnobacter sp.]
MPAGWVTVLQMVPWTEVIKNAPKVAEGAVKLWNTVSKKNVDGQVDVSVPLAAIDELTELELQAERLARAEEQLAVLQQEMLQSSQLIKELAAQNAQLVKQVEVNRKAVTLLGVVLALMAVGLVTQAVALFAV